MSDDHERVHGASAGDDFDALRGRWRDLLTGGSGFDPHDAYVVNAIATQDVRVGGYWERMDKSPGRAVLWKDLGPGTSSSSAITGAHIRLADMARAYATPGSRYIGNDRFLQDTIDGLDFLNAHEYNETLPERGNWWDWEIGTPLALNNATALLFDRLSTAQIANYTRAVEGFTAVPDIFNNSKTRSTGANRVWKAEVVAVRGVLVRDAAKLIHARDSLSEVFPFVTQEDGFYADGSFIQHGKHPYTGGYGTALIAELGNLLYLLGGSPYAVTDPGLANIWASIHDAYEPLIYRGAMMDMVRGREISRYSAQDHAAGHAVIRAILTLAQVAPPADAIAYKRMVKGWIARDTYRDFLATAPLNALLLALSLRDDPAIPLRDEPIGHRQYPQMDRVIHRRPGWAFGIAMSSERIFTYESINNENLHAWHTGDGMTYLYNDDLAQFSDDFWPTVDPYRLPGTTVDTRRRAAGDGQSQAPATQWVGGASLADIYGAVGMELKAYGSDLVGRKSWFLLNDAVVCLGAGITSSAHTPIETTIENRKLNAAGDNVLTVDGAVKPATLGYTEHIEGARWLHLAGTGGYVLDTQDGQDTQQSVQATREARTGSWRDLNQSTTMPSVTRNYLTLWYDHGIAPHNATYVYTVLPNKSADETAAYAANPDTYVIANTAQAQAISAHDARLIAANFWQPGQIDTAATTTTTTATADANTPVAFIRADAPASVIVREDGGALLLAVADPTHKGTRVVIALGRAATAVQRADPTVTITQLAPTVIVVVNVSGAKGATHRVTLTLE